MQCVDDANLVLLARCLLCLCECCHGDRYTHIPHMFIRLRTQTLRSMQRVMLWPIAPPTLVSEAAFFSPCVFALCCTQAMSKWTLPDVWHNRQRFNTVTDIAQELCYAHNVWYCASCVMISKSSCTRMQQSFEKRMTVPKFVNVRRICMVFQRKICHVGHLCSLSMR